MKLRVFILAMMAGFALANAASTKLTPEQLRERAEADPAVAVELATQLMQDPQADPDEIIRLSRFAANKGLPQGRFLFGKCYGEGIGVKKNLRTAFALYRQAAMDGDPDGLNALGLCYASGLGTKPSQLEAYAAFVESALLNNRDAKYNLGRVYERGLGVDNNLKTATYWYGQAAKQGHPQAAERLKELAPDISNEITHSIASAPPASTASNSPSPAKTTNSVDTPKSPAIPQIKETPPAPPTNSTSPSPQTAKLPERTEDNLYIPFPKWILWGFIPVLAVGGTAWWVIRYKKFRPASHAEKHSHHDDAPHDKGGDKTFSCIRCGQLLLIPNYSSRKVLECPSCHVDYEVWRDKNGVLHLQNRDSRSGMSTYISFGQEPTMQSPYHVLGVREGCSLDEARTAFRQRMKEYHPDKVINLGKELRELAAVKAREINEAYNLVVQQKKR